jgi:glutathione S-transferase
MSSSFLNTLRSDMKLIIADKNYSSWSMRPWVLMKHAGIAFDEVLIELNQTDTPARIHAYSPTNRVPCLVTDDGQSIWESLAIAETLAERYPQQALWPHDAAARAHARAIASEMHAGFVALRSSMPMNIRASKPGVGATPAALADVARIDAIWSECLEHYGGPFLFGASFGIADAMYAPVVMRFNTYGPPLSDAARAYAERVTALPAVREWIDDARRETHVIAYYDNDE